MPARLHDRAAHAAGHPGALVDPHPLRVLQTEVRTALAAAAIQSYEPPRVPDDLAQLPVVDVAHSCPGTGAAEEERFDLVDVADAGDRALIEERRRDVAVLVRADAADRFVHVEV